jgi:hypothetical protein
MVFAALLVTGTPFLWEMAAHLLLTSAATAYSPLLRCTQNVRDIAALAGDRRNAVSMTAPQCELVTLDERMSALFGRRGRADAYLCPEDQSTSGFNCFKVVHQGEMAWACSLDEITQWQGPSTKNLKSPPDVMQAAEQAQGLLDAERKAQPLLARLSSTLVDSFETYDHQPVDHLPFYMM